VDSSELIIELTSSTSEFERVEEPLPTMEPPASAAWRRGMAHLVIIVLLSAGLVLLLVVSLPSLVYGPERTLTLVSQDFPFDNTTYRAGLSRSFWLSAAESIRPELVESITNRSTGALIWQGPVFAV